MPDHLCRVHHCVNPAHLEPVTQQENVRRGDAPSGANMRKTHCKRGHEFTEQNTYKFPTRSGREGRACRACKKAQNDAIAARKVQQSTRP